jgi:hypothetical protein
MIKDLKDEKAMLDADNLQTSENLARINAQISNLKNNDELVK